MALVVAAEVASSPVASASTDPSNKSDPEASVDAVTRPPEMLFRSSVDPSVDKAPCLPSVAANPPPPGGYYPATPRRLGIRGRVIVRVTVASSGCMTSRTIAEFSGSDALDQAALRMVERMKFRPMSQNGKAVGSVLYAPVRFDLKQDADAKGDDSAPNSAPN